MVERVRETERERERNRVRERDRERERQRTLSALMCLTCVAKCVRMGISCD